MYHLRGQASEVLTCAARAEAHWKDAERARKQLAIQLRGLGHVGENYPAAIEAYQETLKLYRDASPESEDVAIGLNDLAGAERLLKITMPPSAITAKRCGLRRRSIIVKVLQLTPATLPNSRWIVALGGAEKLWRVRR